MKKIVLSLCLAASLFANENLLEDDFNNLFEEINQVATHAKVNIDYLPSVVHVIDEERIRQSGADNLLDVLNLVPGIDTSMTSIGWKYPIIRGQKSSTFTGHDKIKLLVDHIPVTNKTTGAINFFMEFPTSLIERVEVLKGAGSAVYGNGALSGVINVVTKSSSAKESSVHISAGDKSFSKISTTATTDLKNFTLTLDGYYLKEDFATNTPLATFQRLPILVNGKGSDNRIKDKSVGFQLKGKNLTFTSRVLEHESGNYFGIIEAIESKKDFKQVDKVYFSELLYRDSILEKEINFKVGFNKFDNDYGHRVVPENIYVMLNPAATEDILYKTAVKEESVYAELSSKLLQNSEHTSTLGVFIDEGKNLSNSYSFNATGDSTLMKFDSGYIGKGRDRKTTAIFFEEIYTPNQELAFALNLRDDHYSTYGSFTSFRGGVSYHQGNSIYKASIASSHRVPTWFEQYGNITLLQVVENTTNLKVEEEEIAEFEYTYKPNNKERFSFNVYKLKVKDPIDFMALPIATASDGTPINGVQSNNMENRYVDGIDIEYDYKFDSNNKIFMSASYLDISGDGKTYDEMAQHAKLVATKLGKISYVYNDRKVNLSTDIIYRGSIKNYVKDVVYGDIDTYIKSYTTVNPSLKYRANKDLTVNIDIDNIFNDEVKVSYTNYGVLKSGIPVSERRYKVSIDYKF